MFDKLAYGALVLIKPSQALQPGAYQNGAPFRAFLQAPDLTANIGQGWEQAWVRLKFSLSLLCSIDGRGNIFYFVLFRSRTTPV